jgi:H+-transporting ATPase
MEPGVRQKGTAVFFFLLLLASFRVRSWLALFMLQTAFTWKRDFGKEDRENRWALSRRDNVERRAFSDHLLSSTMPSSRIADQAKRRAEITR